MCECLSYEDGAEYLCEACGPRWREYEASIQRRPVTAPAPLDAAVEEARAIFDAFSARRIDDDNPEAPTLREAVLAMEAALRALLAEEPPVGQLVEGEPGHESCVGCGGPVAPSEDQVREFAYYLGGDRAVAAIEAVPTPSPLPPEVREAAEEGRVVVTATRRVGDKDTMSFDGTTFTTVRACCDCGVLICGGPTRCLYCAAKLPTSAPGAECTGIAASWCPVHGNCSCPRDEEGARTENRFGVDCPLHGLASNHGDAEVSALAARRGA